MKIIRLIVLLVGCCVTLQAAEVTTTLGVSEFEWRTWTHRDGRKIDACMVQYSDSRVYLSVRNQKGISQLAINALSESDQQYVQQFTNIGKIPIRGFREISFGDPVKKIPNRRLIKGTEALGESISETEKMGIGSVALQSVAYAHVKGLICEIVITAKGFENIDGLKEAMNAKYGRGYDNKTYEMIEWRAAKQSTATGTLVVNRATQTGILLLKDTRYGQAIRDATRSLGNEAAKDL